MRLSVLLKNDCNDTSQQNFFFLCLVTDQIPRRITETSRNVQNSGFDRILTRTFPDAITNWAAEPQVGIVSNSDRIVVPVENYE